MDMVQLNLVEQSKFPSSLKQVRVSLTSLESRLSIPDFVSQLWNGKLGFEASH